MAIFDLYSKRQADEAKSGQADVYQYDVIPSSLRVQIKYISLEAIGRVSSYPNNANPAWEMLEQIFLREKGLDSIGSERFSGSRIVTWMASCSVADWLDFLELIAAGIVYVSKQFSHADRKNWEVKVREEDALNEINYRLRQAGVGFQIEEGRLFRVDSQFIHAEITKPALMLLSGEGFDGPRQEFLSAHRHFREGEHRQAVAMAANALESTFKAIFDQKGWVYSKGSRISDLVKVARTHHLWPEYMDKSFEQLTATLQSGLPQIRNEAASHGQGAEAKDVPAYIAAYALHLAASKIVFIVEAAKDATGNVA